jgi:hypothetical protein
MPKFKNLLLLLEVLQQLDSSVLKRSSTNFLAEHLLNTSSKQSKTRSVLDFFPGFLKAEGLVFE